MFDHGYSDEAIAHRLRYDVEKVRAVREKSQNTNAKLKINDNKKAGLEPAFLNDWIGLLFTPQPPLQ